MAIRLVQVDPSEAVHIYAKAAKVMPQQDAERVIQRFLDSGLKCVRVEDDEYTTHGIHNSLTLAIRNRKLRDILTVRQNLSKVYLIRK